MGKKAKGKDKARKGRKDVEELGSLARAVEQPPVPALPERPGDDGRQLVGASELASRLAGLSTVLQRHLARSESGEGLTRARLSALGLLVMGGPRTLGELAAAEHVRPPTMTRLVHAMEADGLVQRVPNPTDGRSVVIHATARGEEQLAVGRQQQVAPLAEAISELDRAERLQLEDAADLLGRLLRSSAWEPVQPAE